MQNAGFTRRFSGFDRKKIRAREHGLLSISGTLIIPTDSVGLQISPSLPDKEKIFNQCIYISVICHISLLRAHRLRFTLLKGQTLLRFSSFIVHCEL